MCVHKEFRPKPRRAAFTLVEVMVVVAIIAVLTGIVIGVAGVVSRSNDRKKCLADMQRISNGLEEYRSKFNKYIDYTGSTADGSWQNEFKRVVPLSDITLNDPWARPFDYVYLSKFQYRLYSRGPDGVTNTVDDVGAETGLQ